MAMTAIQKEKWAMEIIAQLEVMHVASRVCNTDVVMQGADKWHIVAAGDVTVFDVDDNADITYSDTADSETVITKNYDKGFGLLIKDTDRMQTDYNYERIFARRGAYKLGQALDVQLLQEYENAGDDFYITGTTPWQFTKATCVEVPAFFAQLLKLLRDNEVDGLGMPYVIGPTGFGEAIDTYTDGRETALGDQHLLAGGQRMFTFGGFLVFISNNCTTVSTVTHGLAGIIGDGIGLGTYVDPELIELVGRAEGRWGDLVRGRLAAGEKVYRDEAVIDVNFNETVVATT